MRGAHSHGRTSLLLFLCVLAGRVPLTIQDSSTDDKLSNFCTNGRRISDKEQQFDNVCTTVAGEGERTLLA